VSVRQSEDNGRVHTVEITNWFIHYLVCRRGPFEMLVICTTTISDTNRCKAIGIVVPFSRYYDNFFCYYCCIGLENRDYGLYPQKLVLTSPTSGGRLVGIVCSQTKATELVIIVSYLAVSFLSSFVQFSITTSYYSWNCYNGCYNYFG
jgi:hypothetical protein